MALKRVGNSVQSETPHGRNPAPYPLQGFFVEKIMKPTFIARKTEFDGVVYKSKSEAIFARMLYERGFEMVDYEPEWTQLDCGYVADFSAYSITESPLGMFELNWIIEYKPAPVTDTYQDELLARFNKIRDRESDSGCAVADKYFLVTGSAFDSRPCQVLAMSASGKSFRPANSFISSRLKADIVAAKDYRFDLK